MLLLLEEREIQNKSIGRADNKWLKFWTCILSRSWETCRQIQRTHDNCLSLVHLLQAYELGLVCAV